MRKKRLNKRENNIIYQEGKFPLRGLIFNLLAAIYFTFIAPIVSRTSIEAFTTNNTFKWLGTFIIIISLLEIYAFPKKMKLVMKIAIDNKKDLGALAGSLWYFHFGISVFSMFFIFDTFGCSEVSIKEGLYPTWFIFLIFIVSIKEILLLIPLFTEKAIDDSQYFNLKKSEWFYDLVLVLYSWFGLTILWTGTLLGDKDMHKENIGEYIINIILASTLFLMYYFPLRIPYLVEEIALIKTRKDKALFIFSILIVLVSVISKL